jgi:O-antigen/teichoic acid export membrane protein
VTHKPTSSEPRQRDGSPPSWARGWATDSSQLLLSQILTVIATSFAAIVIARALDPDDWGVFSAFLGLSIALTLASDFGIGTWLLRELSRLYTRDEPREHAHRIGGLVSAAVFVNAGIAVPLIIAAAVWALVARPGAAVSIALVSLLVYGMVSAGANALEACLRARRDVRLVLVASLFEKGALIVLLLAITALDLGLGAIGIAYLTAGFSRVAFDSYVVFARQGLPFVTPSPRRVAGVARASMPFALNAASLNLVPRLDTLVLIVMSATSAAWFAIGERALGPALLVPATLGSALYPFMAQQAAKNTAPWKLAGLLGIAGAGLAVVGIVLAPFLVPLVFGEPYRDSVPVVQVMLLVVPLVYATSTLLVVAYSHGLERSLLIPGLVISFGGTLAIVIGQAVGGPTLAAVGYVARSALLLLVVGTVALVAWRRHSALPAAGDISSPSRTAAQTQ